MKSLKEIFGLGQGQANESALASIERFHQSTMKSHSSSVSINEYHLGILSEPELVEFFGTTQETNINRI